MTVDEVMEHVACGASDGYARVLADEVRRLREALEYFATLRGDTLIVDINRRARNALRAERSEMTVDEALDWAGNPERKTRTEVRYVNEYVMTVLAVEVRRLRDIVKGAHVVTLEAKRLLDDSLAENVRLNKALQWEQHRSGQQHTHGPDCHLWGPANYECLMRKFEQLKRDLESWQEAEAGMRRLQKEWVGYYDGMKAERDRYREALGKLCDTSAIDNTGDYLMTRWDIDMIAGGSSPPGRGGGK